MLFRSAKAVAGISVDWLPRLEAAAQAHPREAAVAFGVGMASADRQLWGKARRLLEEAAADAALTPPSRRRAWLTLARIAQQEGDTERSTACFEAAARVV